MIAHELGHLAGNDPRWCLLANALAALLWWHPAVWWLRRRLHVESELAADEASLLITNGPRALSECLIELGARLVRPPAMGGLGASGFRSIIGRRVQRLLKLQETSFRRPDHRKTLLFKILGPIAMAIIVIVCTAWTAPGQMTKGQNMNGKQVKPSLAALTFAAVITGGNITTSLAQAPETAAPAATGALAGAPQKGLPSN